MNIITTGKRIQPKDFRFSLVTDTETLVLTHHPIGWQEYGEEWARKRDDRGYGGKMVIDLRFVKEGADFLRKVFAQGEIEAKCRLRVEKCNRSTWQYYVEFESDFNFSLYEDFRHRDANYVSVQVMESDIIASMKGNEKAVFELDMPDRVTVNETANAINTATWEREYKRGDTISHYGAYLESSEITSDNIVVKTPSVNQDEIMSDWMMELKPSNYRYIPEIKLSYYLPNIELVGNINGQIFIRRGYASIDNPESITWLDELLIFETTILDLGKTLEGNVTVSAFDEMLSDRIYYININDRLTYTDANNTPYQSVTDADLRLDMSVLAEPLVQPFSFPAIRLFDLGRELLARIAPDYTFESGLLENDSILSTCFVASGDAIRNIEGAKLKTSWTDYRKSIASLHPYCLQADTVNKIVRLEDIEQAYKKNVEILDLGVVDSLSVEPYQEDVYNLVNIGIADPDYKMVNGRFEFNNEYQFKCPILKNESEGDFLSKYRTDSFGVTAARYEAEQSETTDSKSDKDSFIIHCNSKTNPTPYLGHQLVGDDIQLQRTGVFNIGLTPHRCLKRQERLLLVGLRKTDRTLRWQTSAKTSANLESRFQDPITGEWDSVVEKSDVVLEGEPLYIAKRVRFTARIPKNLPELMHKNIGGYISFTWQGKKYKGFPLQVVQRPVHNSAQEIAVVLHPETDIV